MSDSVTPWTVTHQAPLPSTVSQSLLRFTPIESVMLTNHLLLPPFSPLAFNLSHHQDIFQWACSLHQVAKVLKLQLQQQSFQYSGLICFRSPCSLRDSQKYSPASQFESISSSVGTGKKDDEMISVIRLTMIRKKSHYSLAIVHCY